MYDSARAGEKALQIQNEQYPSQENLSWHCFLVGVTSSGNFFQFIFSDGHRTHSACPGQWTDHYLREKPLARVDLMYSKSQSLLMGMKFVDCLGHTVISVGAISDSEQRTKLDNLLILLQTRLD